MTKVECTLEMMLAARDERRARQVCHFREHPGQTLLVATVVAPGPYKLTERTLKVAMAERKALRSIFAENICSEVCMDFPSGPETWLTLDMPEIEAKRLAAHLEDTHKLGRLFDIDIITSDLAPLSRTALGISPRHCLLCENEARVCMRAKAHTPEQIEDYINTLVDSYSD